MPTFRNNKTGEQITTELTTHELLKKFGETIREDNWLMFWIAKNVEERAQSNPANREMVEFLGDSFLYAIGMGLKRPMIRLHWAGARYKIYLSQKGTLCFKTGMLVPGTNDPQGNEEYMGCLYSGKFLPNKRRTIRTWEQDMLERLGTDPVQFLATAGKDMDRCCFCYRALEDPRSKDVGYGKICAEHWGLPYGKSYDENVPSFAKLWANANGEDKRNVRGLFMELRKNPRDTFLWSMVADALTDAGFSKRPECPDRAVVVPSAP